jgi:hypothetical protein
MENDNDQRKISSNLTTSKTLVGENLICMMGREQPKLLKVIMESDTCPKYVLARLQAAGWESERFTFFLKVRQKTATGIMSGQLAQCIAT